MSDKFLTEEDPIINNLINLLKVLKGSISIKTNDTLSLLCDRIDLKIRPKIDVGSIRMRYQVGQISADSFYMVLFTVSLMALQMIADIRVCV